MLITNVMNKKLATVEEYISAFPPGMQEILQQVRMTIQKAAPAAGCLLLNFPAHSPR